MTQQPRILLVDDEPAIQRSVGLLLRARGYDVQIAGTGTEALAGSTRNRISVLDQGFRIWRHQVAVDRTTSQVPIVVLSAWRRLTKECPDLGADDYTP
jgi:two-component system KDP operon response regulator KdpE